MSESLQYVVLHHTGVAEPHYDLMLEFKPGDQLLTWRSPVWPLEDKTELTPLDPHRRDYLTFEGELSNNRGVVKRVASGTYTLVHRALLLQIIRFDDTGEEWLIGTHPGGSIAIRATK